MERENSGAFAANVLTFVQRAHRVSRVFDNRNAMLFSNGINAVDITRRARIVNRNNRFGARCDGSG
ncbi:hypothetical protein D3C81_2175470 [compost metagenome]